MTIDESIAKIGDYVYIIHDHQIFRSKVLGVRIIVRLNTGSSKYGKLLDPTIEFLLNPLGASKYYYVENVFLDKESLIKTIP